MRGRRGPLARERPGKEAGGKAGMETRLPSPDRLEPAGREGQEEADLARLAFERDHAGFLDLGFVPAERPCQSLAGVGSMAFDVAATMGHPICNPIVPIAGTGMI